MKYKHIFFDLDRTLWDFEKNSTEALNEIFHINKLADRGVSNVELFIKTYKIINERLWELYRKDEINKEYLRKSRFQLTLENFGILDQDLAYMLGRQYVSLCPLKKNLFPATLETLNYLKDKYKLHIITNGFEEVQYLKLNNSHLFHFFDNIITSEQVGCKKPDPKIFNHALIKALAKSNECLMIGDDLIVDLLGAKNVGIDQLYFNPNKEEHTEKLTYEVTSLKELQRIL